MATSKQHSFAPDEFVQRWLFGVNHPEHGPQRERPKHALDTVLRNVETQGARYLAQACFGGCVDDLAGKTRKQSKRRRYTRQVRSPLQRHPRAWVLTSFRAGKVGGPHPNKRTKHLHHTRDTSQDRQEDSRYLPHRVFDHANMREQKLKSFRRERPRSTRSQSARAAQITQTLRESQSRLGDIDWSSSKRLTSSAVTQDPILPETSAAPLLKEEKERRYERKPRHKTRTDRYKLKVDKRTKETSGLGFTRHKSNRNRRKKSGLTLNHNFKAPNVQHERLTLKSHCGPGIFHKGKASARVERRGLPDLTFSEMTFLTKRRELGDARYRGPEEAQPFNKNSNKASEREISSFFSRPQEKHAISHTFLEEASRLEKVSAQSSISHNRSSPGRLGLRRPLSVISRMKDSARLYSTYSRDADGVDSGMLIPEVPLIQDFSEIRKGPQSLVQSNDATSHYSWFITPSRKDSRHAGGGIQPDTHQRLKMDSVCHSLKVGPSKTPIAESSGQIPDQSSISDRSLDQYTKHILLSKDEQGLWDRVPRPPGADCHYTLDDLKRLARLSELDIAVEHPNEQYDQHLHPQFTDMTFYIIAHPGGKEGLLPGETSKNRRDEILLKKSTSTSRMNEVHGHLESVVAGDDLGSSKQGSAHPSCQVSNSVGLLTHSAPEHPLLLQNVKLSPNRVAWLFGAEVFTSESNHHGGCAARQSQFGNFQHPSASLWQDGDGPEDHSPLHSFVRPFENGEKQGDFHPGGERKPEAANSFNSAQSFDNFPAAHAEQHCDHSVDHSSALPKDYDQKNRLPSSDRHDEFDRYLLEDLRNQERFDDTPAKVLGGSGYEHSNRIPSTRDKNYGRLVNSEYHINLHRGSKAPNYNDMDITENGSRYADAQGELDARLNGGACAAINRYKECAESEQYHADAQEHFMGFSKPHILY